MIESIIANGIFTGIGTAIGSYIGTRYVLHHLQQAPKKINAIFKKKGKRESGT